MPALPLSSGIGHKIQRAIQSKTLTFTLKRSDRLAKQDSTSYLTWHARTADVTLAISSISKAARKRGMDNPIGAAPLAGTYERHEREKKENNILPVGGGFAATKKPQCMSLVMLKFRQCVNSFPLFFFPLIIEQSVTQAFSVWPSGMEIASCQTQLPSDSIGMTQ
jgi:hypothetical protein